MNLTAFGLMSPTFQRLTLREALESKYPKLALAIMGTRLIRSDGSQERFITLWDSKTQDTKVVGRCSEKTMQLMVDAELWEFSDGQFTDHCPDFATDRWYRSDAP